MEPPAVRETPRRGGDGHHGKSRFRQGLRLSGQSWALIRSHGGLLAFPVLGAVLGLVLVGPPAIAGAYLADEGDTVPGVLLLVVATYLVSFISAFVGVALVAATDAALRGEKASVGQGIRAARSRLGAISGWALINALLTVLLRALESRGALGNVAAALVGGAWSVISLLALPVIAIEDSGPVTAIRRSASIFKQHWVGQVTGMAAIGAAVFLIAILPAIVLIVLGFVVISDEGGAGLGGEVLIGVGLVLLAVGAVLTSALRQVFAVVLYRFLSSGEAPRGFSADDLQSAVRTS
jgi:Family of unknown function (DUF6159)